MISIHSRSHRAPAGSERRRRSAVVRPADRTRSGSVATRAARTRPSHSARSWSSVRGPPRLRACRAANASTSARRSRRCDPVMVYGISPRSQRSTMWRAVVPTIAAAWPVVRRSFGSSMSVGQTEQTERLDCRRRARPGQASAPPANLARGSCFIARTSRRWSADLAQTIGGI